MLPFRCSGHRQEAAPSLEPDRVAQTRYRHSPLRNSAHPEGGRRDALPEGLGQAVVRHGDVRDGDQHAGKDGGLRQHPEARRHQLQNTLAGRIYSGEHFCTSLSGYSPAIKAMVNFLFPSELAPNNFSMVGSQGFFISPDS